MYLEDHLLRLSRLYRIDGRKVTIRTLLFEYTIVADDAYIAKPRSFMKQR